VVGNVLNLSCDQAWPPAGDLGHVGTVLEEEDEGEERVVGVVRGRRMKMECAVLFIDSKCDEILPHSLQ